MKLFVVSFSVNLISSSVVGPDVHSSAVCYETTSIPIIDMFSLISNVIFWITIKVRFSKNSPRKNLRKLNLFWPGFNRRIKHSRSGKEHYDLENTFSPNYILYFLFLDFGSFLRLDVLLVTVVDRGNRQKGHCTAHSHKCSQNQYFFTG
jgi:hypothetical protein